VAALAANLEIPSRSFSIPIASLLKLKRNEALSLMYWLFGVLEAKAEAESSFLETAVVDL
jgi:hypothetical protein